MDTVKYVDSLARKNSEALSFIPRPRLEQYEGAGQILMAYENGDPCGFLVHGIGARHCRIYQACIQYDARFRQHGLDLVARLTGKAAGMHFDSISLWCADDLEANGFWKAAGFEFVVQRDGGVRRGRKHNLWRLPLQPLLYAAHGEGRGE